MAEKECSGVLPLLLVESVKWVLAAQKLEEEDEEEVWRDPPTQLSPSNKNRTIKMSYGLIWGGGGGRDSTLASF